MPITIFGNRTLEKLYFSSENQPTNVKERSAVAVMKETEVVGHVPYNISSAISMFLQRECNKGFAEVTGNCVNRGAGYGMEVQTLYYTLITET